MKKLIALMLALVLALSLAACGGTPAPTDPATQPPTENQTEPATDPQAENPETGVAFTVVVEDLEGNQTTFEYTSSAASVGEALLAEGLLEGEEGPYGLYINAVNGITADWDADGTYWGFYIDGEYALTGVDMTEITEGATYSFVLTKG